MLTRATRWFLITGPVVAGILVLIFGTAGTVSVTLGIVLIGIGPIVWLWNWFIRMSFDDYEEREQQRKAERAEPPHVEPQHPAEQLHHPAPQTPHRHSHVRHAPRRRPR